jgi:hypothetical protein
VSYLHDLSNVPFYQFSELDILCVNCVSLTLTLVLQE